MRTFSYLNRICSETFQFFLKKRNESQAETLLIKCIKANFYSVEAEKVLCWVPGTERCQKLHEKVFSGVDSLLLCSSIGVGDVMGYREMNIREK